MVNWSYHNQKRRIDMDVRTKSSWFGDMFISVDDLQRQLFTDARDFRTAVLEAEDKDDMAKMLSAAMVLEDLVERLNDLKKAVGT